MGAKVWTWVLDHCPFSGARFNALVAMSRFADDAGGSIFPSFDLLAHQAHSSERGCHYAVAALEKAGIVRREHRGGSGAGDKTQWAIVMDPAQWSEEARGLHAVRVKRAQEIAQRRNTPAYRDAKRVHVLHPSTANKGANDDKEGCNQRRGRVQSGANSTDASIPRSVIEKKEEPGPPEPDVSSSRSESETEEERREKQARFAKLFKDLGAQMDRKARARE